MALRPGSIQTDNNQPSLPRFKGAHLFVQIRSTQLTRDCDQIKCYLPIYGLVYICFRGRNALITSTIVIWVSNVSIQAYTAILYAVFVWDYICLLWNVLHCSFLGPKIVFIFMGQTFVKLSKQWAFLVSTL